MAGSRVGYAKFILHTQENEYCVALQPGGACRIFLHTRENFIRLESILGGIYDEEERFPGHY